MKLSEHLLELAERAERAESKAAIVSGKIVTNAFVVDVADFCEQLKGAVERAAARLKEENEIHEALRCNGGYITDGNYSVGVDFTDKAVSTCMVKREGDDFKVVDTHEYTKPEDGPETEWVYGVWKSQTRDRYRALNKKVWCGSAPTVEDAIKLLLTDNPMGQAGCYGGIPLFGVRKTVKGEGGCKYCACYEGKRILMCNAETPERVIEKVIEKLTPAVPAVNLEDLKVADDG